MIEKEKLKKRYQEYGKDYYHKNKEKLLKRAMENYRANRGTRLENAKKRYRNPETFPRVVLDRCKQRARKTGIPFDIKKEDIVIPEFCPVFGCKLERAKGGKAAFNSPSIDRIIPSLGYVKENIQVVSYLANVMKNNATIPQLISFAEWIIRTYKNGEPSIKNEFDNVVQTSCAINPVPDKRPCLSHKRGRRYLK